MFRLREDLYSQFPEKNSGSRPVSESSVTKLVGSHRESVEAEKSNSSSKVQCPQLDVTTTSGNLLIIKTCIWEQVDLVHIG